jgi:hypothetical protein
MPETPSTPQTVDTEQAALLERVVSRRALLAVGAGAGIVWLTGCGSGGAEVNAKSTYYPDMGFPTTSPQPEDTSPAPDTSETASDEPSADADSTESPAQPAVERYKTKPEVRGRELKLDWTSWDNKQLAGRIRRASHTVSADPRTAGLADRSYYHKSVVVGASANAFKGKKIYVVVVTPGAESEYADQIAVAALPRGTVTEHGETIPLLPAPVNTDRDTLVHPYRVRKGPTDLQVAFLTTDDNGSNPTVIAPYVLNPNINVANGTYSNAHLI